jgi:hypothetical protein
LIVNLLLAFYILSREKLQLNDLVEAAEINLDLEDVVYLEELYKPVDKLLSIGFS